jgi:alkylation response protein AidB-like acyl-CoA dehydrogenase
VIREQALFELNSEAASWASEACEWLQWFANRRLNSQLMDERRTLNPLPVLEFGNKGLMAMQVASEYGGLGLPAFAAGRVFEQLGAIDLTLATFIVNNNCLGIRTFERGAQAARKAELLPELAAGRELISFALSEAGAGSQPKALQSVARRQGDGWLLSGDKMWIGNAAWANHLNVFCRLQDEHGVSTELTAFCVQQERPGVAIGPELLTMGMRAMVQNTIQFESVALSASDMLGAAHQGMSVANDAMMHTRLAFASTFLGAMRRSLQTALQYVSKRQVSTGLLRDNPVTMDCLHEGHAKVELIDALVDVSCASLDAGKPLPEDFYIVCKVMSSEFLWEVADSCVQLCGGRGYLENNVLARFLRDARVGRIYEGPSETLLHFIGMRILKGSTALRDCLVERLGCPEMATLLDEVLQELRSDRRPAKPVDWIAYQLGWVASWMALIAARKAWQGSDELEVSAWANRCLDLRVSAALDGPGKDASVALIQALSGYTKSVGNIRETLPGAASELDEWMR